MTTKYNGDPANITFPLAARTITGATNATPIVVTTSVNHGYGDNDTVEVAGVVGNTAANGFWKITWLSATTYSLDGSVGNGAYVSGGTSNDYSLTPELTEPVDGELRSVASVELMTRALADRAQFDALRMTPLADLTALAAHKVPTNKLVRYVSGFGPYTFLTSATTGLSPFRVAAADATAGGWVAGAAYETSVTKRIFIKPLASFNNPSPWQVTNFDDAPLNTGRFRDMQFKTSAVTTGAGQYHYLQSIDQNLIQGATIASATLRFRPVGSHAGLPTRQVGFALIRAPIVGLTQTSVSLQSGGTSGFAVLAAGTVGAYEADQALVFTANQNNVIDLDTYMYGLMIGDESGANALIANAYKRLDLVMTSVLDARRDN